MLSSKLFAPLTRIGISHPVPEIRKEMERIVHQDDVTNLFFQIQNCDKSSFALHK